MSFVQESTTSEINGILGEQYTPLFVVPGFVCCSYAVEFPARPGGQRMFASLSKHATYIHSFCLIHISSSWLFCNPPSAKGNELRKLSADELSTDVFDVLNHSFTCPEPLSIGLKRGKCAGMHKTSHPLYSARFGAEAVHGTA